jgi:hypothetical protein
MNLSDMNLPPFMFIRKCAQHTNLNAQYVYLCLESKDFI